MFRTRVRLKYRPKDYGYIEKLIGNLSIQIINPLFDGWTDNTRIFLLGYFTQIFYSVRLDDDDDDDDADDFTHWSHFPSPLRGSKKILRHLKNIRAYHLLNHQIMCICCSSILSLVQFLFFNPFFYRMKMI